MNTPETELLEQLDKWPLVRLEQTGKHFSTKGLVQEAAARIRELEADRTALLKAGGELDERLKVSSGVLALHEPINSGVFKRNDSARTNWQNLTKGMKV